MPKSAWTHLVLGAILVAASGCAPTRQTVPPPDSLSTPSLTYRALQDRPLELRVIDARGEQEGSAELVALVDDAVQKALSSAGVVIGGDSEELTIRVTRYRADFDIGRWTGCTAMSASLSYREDAVLQTERCTTLSNMSGYRTADRTLRMSLGDALADLLAQLDALRPPVEASGN